jgi:hypothetical protein
MNPQYNKMINKCSSNNSILVIDDSSGKVESAVNGIIELGKIAVTTTYDVCSDEVKDFKDFENFWILKDGDNYYHWLRPKKEDPKEEDPNKAKLEFLDNIIPITLHSTQEFRFTAKFKVLLPIKTDGIKIRVNRKDEKDTDKYNFKVEEITPTGDLSKDSELTVIFSATNNPYKDTIQYFEKFELFFEYSFDGKTWIPLREVYFRLYLTWKEPLWTNFSKNDTASIVDFPKVTMQIKHRFVAGGLTDKPAIFETFLWLGCFYAKGVWNNSNITKNHENILDAIFAAFEKRKVTRKNEIKWISEGLGYWRGKSRYPTSGTTELDIYRNLSPNRNALRFLLLHGEARCGEWDEFFRHVAMCQHIILKSYVILSQEAVYKSKSYSNSQYFLVKSTSGWNIIDPKAPTEKPPVSTVIPDGYKAQGNFTPMHYFKDHVFTIFVKSNGSMKYYDPSYGIKSSSFYSDKIELLKDYTRKALQGIVYFKPFPATMTDHLDYHFIHDLHFKHDLHEQPFLFDTKEIDMENHLYPYIIQ